MIKNLPSVLGWPSWSDIVDQIDGKFNLLSPRQKKAPGVPGAPVDLEDDRHGLIAHVHTGPIVGEREVDPACFVAHEAVDYPHRSQVNNTGATGDAVCEKLAGGHVCAPFD